MSTAMFWRTFLAAALLALVALGAPARADDISVAGRSVVRVVVIAFGEEGEVTGFGHGSGFAIAPNRIVTNAHVVAQAQQGGGSVRVGVVPSEGAQPQEARIIAVDPARDLALLEVEQGGFTPIPLYVGPLEDGAPIAALGYPGNVDLATVRSLDDYIKPLPPTRSVGIFSNVRPINGITTLLHTASIARGHSGGPLLDQCGRVLGVNTLITRNQDGDAPFAFAVATRELTVFLRQARQPFQAIGSECVSMSDRLQQDRARAEAEARSRADKAAAEAARARETRERALAQIQESRENRLALAILLFALALIAAGGAGILVLKNRPKPAMIMGGMSVLLLVLAIAFFLSRPGYAEAEAAKAEGDAGQAATASRFAGSNLCRLVPERSRVTVSTANQVPFDWAESGCVNGRTQYAQDGDSWTRILVPEGEQAVALLEFTPATGDYVVTRYLLDSAAMGRVRSLRGEARAGACTADATARERLAERQREIARILPRLPNERLVYACENRSGTTQPSR